MNTQRIKWFTQALLVSGTLNIALSATFVYFTLKEREGYVRVELKPAVRGEAPLLTNQALLRSYSALSFQDLLLRLDHKELVELGYTKRDLALSCLVAFHHFNLDRALGGIPLQKRQIAFTNQDGQERVDVTMFPHLADYHYSALLHYAKTEKWPLTAQGLFFEIQRSGTIQQASLLEAFYLTAEFRSLALLFSKTGLSLDKKLLTALMAQGGWEMIHEFTIRQREAQDLSVERRRSFLLSLLNCKSKLAAGVLIATDREFAQQRFDDAQILALLEYIEEPSKENICFAKNLLLSARSDAVWRAAALKLYAFAKESPPEPYDHAVAMHRFVGREKPEEKKPVPVEPKKKTYVVAAGDNLWNIARKHRVSVEALKKKNRLDSEKLKVGARLEIP